MSWFSILMLMYFMLLLPFFAGAVVFRRGLLPQACGVSLPGWGYGTATPSTCCQTPGSPKGKRTGAKAEQGLTLLLGACKGKGEAGVTKIECESPSLMPHTTDLAKTHVFWLANGPPSFKKLEGEVPDSASQLPALNSVALNETAGNAAAATSPLSVPLS